MTDIKQIDPSLSLFSALIKARNTYGAKFQIIEDQERKSLSYDTFIIGACAISRLLKRHIGPAKHIGVMLPSSIGGAISFFALHALSRVPVMINFTSGQTNIKSAIDTARCDTIITSRRFINQAKLEDLVEFINKFCRVIYLDDIRSQLSASDKAFGFMASKMPDLLLPKLKPSDIGVILFTSGSFGLPRGVVLTHANLIANTNQISRQIKLSRSWTFFCPLPIFHSLGLIGGVFLPLLTGIKSFIYPSPLHIKLIPPLIRDTKAHVFFSTDTFLNQYAKVADADDFSSLEFIVCGAEKVRMETRTLFDTQFKGVKIIEGYGVTEASPVVAINDPQDNRPGTVGKLLPQIEARLEPIEGITTGGRLFIKGPNIMAGYIDPMRPDVIEAPVDGWHDTGDIVNIDAEGYVRILGRAKRFAKIAGEMVSLTAVEQLCDQLWPGFRHAVMAVRDDKKGERLVLITDYPDASLDAFSEFAKSQGMSNLALPKTLIKLEAIPLLGSGKLDYLNLQLLADNA